MMLGRLFFDVGLIVGLKLLGVYLCFLCMYLFLGVR